MITAIATIALLKITPIASSPSFPKYNIQAACSHVTDISGGEFTNSIDRCQKDETNAKLKLRSIWKKLPNGAKLICSNKSSEDQGSYVEALTCVNMRYFHDPAQDEDDRTEIIEKNIPSY